MPVRDHPVFRKPDNPDIKIWRYIDFAKYVAFLDTSTLYFPRSDKLDDPYEGTFSPVTWAKPKHVREDMGFGSEAQMSVSQFNSWMRGFIEDAEYHRQWTYVNSWHMNEIESAAMWDLYAQRYQGIAIQSTYAKLAARLPSKVPSRRLGNKYPGWYVKETDVFVGVVEYGDYEIDPISTTNMYYPYMHKRKSFEHERELRAVIWESQLQEYADSSIHHTTTAAKDSIVNPVYGLRVDISINELVEKVVVSPTAPNWFGELVENVSVRYGLDRRCIDKSRLYKRRLI